LSAQKTLSAKMNLILGKLNPHWDLWDVGCDHGLLGFEVLRKGLCKEVYFVDRVASIISQLKITYAEHADKIASAEHRAHFICSQAQHLDPELMKGNIVFAGMGSRQVQRIFQALQLKGKTDTQLLIAANTTREGFEELAEYLSGLGWNLKDKTSFNERRHKRELWVFQM
jgi:tRNA A22 N-methylase